MNIDFSKLTITELEAEVQQLQYSQDQAVRLSEIMIGLLYLLPSKELQELEFACRVALALDPDMPYLSLDQEAEIP